MNTESITLKTISDIGRRESRKIRPSVNSNHTNKTSSPQNNVTIFYEDLTNRTIYNKKIYELKE